MKKCVLFVLVGIVGFVLGAQLRVHGEIEVAGRIGPDLRQLLEEGGHSVVVDHGISRIEGDRTELGESLSIALERELMKADTHRENLECYQVTGYKKKMALVSPQGDAYVQQVHTQGSLQRTDNPFHLAIEGAGFFPVSGPGGQVVYTRGGDFHFDGRTQEVRTAANYPVGLKISDDYCNLTISPTGEASALRYDSAEGKPEVLGQLELVAFDHPENLISLGDGIYEVHPNAGLPKRGKPGDPSLGLGVLAQGHLERSNVNFDIEMAELAQSERRGDFLQKCLTSIRPGIVTY